MSTVNGKIGFLHSRENDEIKLPVTSVDAVIDEYGNTVRELIDEVQPVSTDLIISTSGGVSFHSGVNVLYVQALRNNVDITDDCDPEDFVWTRVEPNWSRVSQFGKFLTIGPSDLVQDKATFICTLNKKVSETAKWEAVSSFTLDGTFSDALNIVGWISSSLTNTIVEDNGSYFPDWHETPLVLTPVIHKVDSSVNLALTRVIARSWKRRMSGDTSWTEVFTGRGGESISPTGVLTVSENKLIGNLYSCEYKYTCTYFDDETNKTLDYEMLIGFSKIQNGQNGQDGLPGQDGEDGAPGQDGIGILSVSQTKRSFDDGGENEWTVTKDDFSVSKFYVNNGSKGSDGTDGQNGWTRNIIYLYRRSERPLTRADLDFGNLTYDVATNSFLEITRGQIGQWFTSTISGSTSLWATSIIINTQDDQVVVTPSQWNTPVILSEIGSSGQAGESLVYLTLYQRADSEPEQIGQNVSFNFITHMISQPKSESGENLPWSLEVPVDNGLPLWSVSAIAQSRDETAVISPLAWSDPLILVKDGKDGIDGRDGQDGKDGADGIDGKDGEDGVDGQNGQDGEDGKSAYEIAVEHGYQGTEEEWLLEMHTEIYFQFAVVAGDYDAMRSYGYDPDKAYGYIDGIGYGLDVTWSDASPINVPDGSYVWMRVKNTYTNLWQYARLTGKTGAAGGFGEVEASISEDGGEPSVEVETSGPNYAKEFSFIFKNIKGRGISSVSFRWALTADSTPPLPQDITSTDILTPTRLLRYLWKKSIVTYTDSTTEDYVSLECVYGEKGDDGTGVSVSNIAYGVSDSEGVQPLQWSQTIPTVSQGSWLWITTSYSDNTQAYSYTYQGKDIGIVNTTEKWALSSSNLTLDTDLWYDSVAQDWYKGKWFWCKKTNWYTDGTHQDAAPYCNEELTNEFLDRCGFDILMYDKTYVPGQSKIIPIKVSSNLLNGSLELVGNIGTFKYYDSNLQSWTSLGSNVVLSIDRKSEFKDYVFEIPASADGIIILYGIFNGWNGEEVVVDEKVFPET